MRSPLFEFQSFLFYLSGHLAVSVTKARALKDSVILKPLKRCYSLKHLIYAVFLFLKRNQTNSNKKQCLQLTSEQSFNKPKSRLKRIYKNLKKANEMQPCAKFVATAICIKFLTIQRRARHKKVTL